MFGWIVDMVFLSLPRPVQWFLIGLLLTFVLAVFTIAYFQGRLTW